LKFLLRHGLGQSAIREIGNHLRAYGSGRHWIERSRGEVYINSGDERDQGILLEVFSNMVDAVDEQSTNAGDQRSNWGRNG
jgi:hypothetical protein